MLRMQVYVIVDVLDKLITWDKGTRMCEYWSRLRLAGKAGGVPRQWRPWSCISPLWRRYGQQWGVRIPVARPGPAERWCAHTDTGDCRGCSVRREKFASLVCRLHKGL